MSTKVEVSKVEVSKMLAPAVTRPVITLPGPGEPFEFAFRWRVWIPGAPGVFADVPAGARTNGGTVPWFSRWLIGRFSPHLVRGWFLHDWLVMEFTFTGYQRPRLWTRDGQWHPLAHRDLSWAESARIMRAIHRQDRAPAWKRELAYWAVRLHGFVKGKQ